MEFIADGWALIKDGDSILFNKLGEYGEDLGYYRFNFKNIVEVSKTEYFKIKYGSAYEHVVKLFGDNITDSEFAPDGSLYVSFFQSSNIHHFDVHGVLLRTFEDPFNTVYDIALDGNSIWCAYPTAHTIKKYSLLDFQEEQCIGEEWNTTVFDHPESVSVYEEGIFVCDMGNYRICMVNRETNEVTEYQRFAEPVWEYLRLEPFAKLGFR